MGATKGKNHIGWLIFSQLDMCPEPMMILAIGEGALEARGRENPRCAEFLLSTQPSVITSGDEGRGRDTGRGRETLSLSVEGKWRRNSGHDLGI